MTYKPRIYIRDYGSPTVRMLAQAGVCQFTASATSLNRDLILHIESPALEDMGVLLSGVAQSGGDVLILSDAAGRLLLTDRLRFRVFGPDATILSSVVVPVTVAGFALSGVNAVLARGLVLRAVSNSFSLTPQATLLKRDLISSAGAGTFVLMGHAPDLDSSLRLIADGVSFNVGVSAANLNRLLVVSGAAASFTTAGGDLGIFFNERIVQAESSQYTLAGTDTSLISTQPGISGAFTLTGNTAGLLRGHVLAAAVETITLSGVDIATARHLIMGADVSVFTLTGVDAVLNADNPEALSGDMQTGADLSLLSGDMQTGTDLLLTS